MSNKIHDNNINFLNKSQIGDYEITITGKKLKNIMDVLAKLNDIREQDIPNEEKNIRVQNVINEYME